MAVCAHSSHLDAPSSHSGTLLLTPLICYTQRITSAVTVMKPQQKKRVFCACLAPILPLIMHPWGLVMKRAVHPFCQFYLGGGGISAKGTS